MITADNYYYLLIIMNCEHHSSLPFILNPCAHNLKLHTIDILILLFIIPWPATLGLLVEALLTSYS